MGRENGIRSERVRWPGARLVISSLRGRAGLDELAARVGYLMVSVKNPVFGARLVEVFYDLVESYLEGGEIILVDTPYAATIEATETDEAIRERKLRTLDTVAREKRRFLERTLGKRGIALPVRSFEDVEREVDPMLVREVAEAFEHEGQFRSEILSRARQVIPEVVPETSLPRFATFLVREIPTLCHIYFSRKGPGIVDVYPDEPWDLFWDIERGAYADVLPRISRLAERSPGVVYVDVRVEPRENLGERAPAKPPVQAEKPVDA